MNVKSAMRNEWIDGLVANHSHAPLLEQKQMRALNAKEIESFSKIDLKDVSWWKSIKNAFRPKALVITRLSKKRCISLVTKGRSFHIANKQD
jgi:predicted transcriptional regulator